MPTECSAELFEFARVEGRSVVAGFDGGKITSDAGAFILGETDRAIGLIDCFARCFTDSRSPSCQSAAKFHPGSACNNDPDGRWLRLVPVANRRDPRASRSGLTSDEAARVGGACLPTGASRGGTQARCLKRQLSFPVSTISQ